MGYLGATLTQVFTRACAERTCHSEMSQLPEMWNGVTECEWRYAPEARGGFWEILKKSKRRVENWTPNETVDFRLLTETFVAGARRVGVGADKKARIERLCLSLLMSKKPLNSKVIKSFVPEKRNRKCFSSFEIPMFYHFGHSMYVSHIAISWLWYSTTTVLLEGWIWH